MNRLVMCLMVLSMILLYNPAFARTPDGQTPAQESVCDGQSGAAFGLCNAYCEAMDCDSSSPQASATACDKVRAGFVRVTGVDIPCEAEPIVCEELQQCTAELCNTADGSIGTCRPAAGARFNNEFPPPRLHMSAFSVSETELTASSFN